MYNHVFMRWSYCLGCKKPTDGQIKLTELIKFFLEVKIHDHANYFVDSLWDHTEVLQVRLVNTGGEGCCFLLYTLIGYSRKASLGSIFVDLLFPIM